MASDNFALKKGPKPARASRFRLRRYAAAPPFNGNLLPTYVGCARPEDQKAQGRGASRTLCAKEDFCVHDNRLKASRRVAKASGCRSMHDFLKLHDSLYGVSSLW